MDYRNHTLRLPDAGLVLVLPADSLQVGNWRKLHNTRSTFEGFIATRPGLSLLHAPGSTSYPIHSMKRLNSASIVYGCGRFVALNGVRLEDHNFSGRPLSILPYRPADADTTWAYIADSQGMRKLKDTVSSYLWGVESPSLPCTATPAGAGILDSSGAGGIAYEWVYTYRTISGAESNPSPLMTSALSLSGERAKVKVFPSSDPQVDEIALYRKGGFWNDFKLQGLYPNVGQEIEDNVGGASIAGNETVFWDSYVPFTTDDEAGLTIHSTPFVWGPFNGNIFLACGIASYPGYVFWTNPGAPDSADVKNLIEVCAEPLVNGWVYSDAPFAVSSDNVYVLQFGSSELAEQVGLLASFQPQLTPVGRGLSAPWAFAVGPKVWFLSKDEIVETDCASPAVSISEQIRPLFYGQTVAGFSPISYDDYNDIRLCYYGRELHFFYIDVLGARKHLIYDTRNQRWRSHSSLEADFICGYTDEQQASHRLLLGGENGKSYVEDYTSLTDNGKAISWHAESFAFDFDLSNTLKETGGIILDCKGTVSVEPLTTFNEVALPSHLVTSPSRGKNHCTISDVYSYTFGVRLSGTGAAEVHSCELLWREDEEEIKHWEFPETSHGIDGWQHIRDGYIALRSSATVVLTIWVDGVSHTYNLPSTAGQRRKVYFDADAVKGKMFRYALDSSAVFRVYGADCELNIKPWNTGKGYSTISPFDKTEQAIRRMGES